MAKNRAGTLVHMFKVHIEDKIIDNLDAVEYNATKDEFSAELFPPTPTTETGERVWSF